MGRRFRDITAAIPTAIRTTITHFQGTRTLTPENKPRVIQTATWSNRTETTLDRTDKTRISSIRTSVAGKLDLSRRAYETDHSIRNYFYSSPCRVRASRCATAARGIRAGTSDFRRVPREKVIVRALGSCRRIRMSAVSFGLRSAWPRIDCRPAPTI